ncbi:Virulence sensor protein BvgS precursor [compost metagenome]
MKFREILDELIANNRRDCQLLTVLLQSGATGKLDALAHRIKGAARVVKGEQLVESCRRLEVICADPHASFEALSRAVTELEHAIMALEDELRAF